jgi:hypothetical protein
MISRLSTIKIARSYWFLDNGASCHMTEERVLFTSLMEKESKVHVELGDDSRYAVNGERKITFHFELGGSLDSHDVLYVLGLKRKLRSVSSMKDKDFSVTFQKGKVIIHP